MLKFHSLKGRVLQPLLLVMLMVGALTFSFQPTITPQMAEAAPGDVRITGIVDGDLSGGNPKAIELYVEGTVDLTGWQVWRAANGGAFTSVGTLAGTYTDEFVYLVGSANNGVAQFDAVFGTSGDFANRPLVSTQINGNGDDSFQIRLPDGVTVIDQVWEANTDDIYRDSFLYRQNCTGPDGANWIASNWIIPGNGELDGLDASQHTAAIPFGTWELDTNCDSDPPPDPDPTPARIYELQENGVLFGNPGPFIVEGVVTNDVQNTLNGFFMQDAVGDGDPTTSDGIFVVAPTSLLDVSVGMVVEVTGTVGESFGQTQITATVVIDTGATDVIIPTVISLPIASVADWENYEGMLITVVGDAGGILTVTDVFNLGRFGEFTVSSGRLFNPTNVYLPGSPQETALREENTRNRLTVDDLLDDTLDLNTPGNVPFIPTTESEFRNGFTTPSITGTLGYGFAAYRLRPTQALVWTNANPRTPTPAAVGGTLTVTSFNVQNYFNGDGVGGGFPTSRGAYSPAEFTRQTAKVVSAICAINADIAGLIEIENDPDVANISAIQTLVAALNAESGCGPYAYIATGTIGTDAIKQAFIYKPATVTAIGDYAILTSAIDPRFNDSRNRPALAQTFEDNNGGRVTIVVNHLKSKGSGCGAGDDSPIQGNCNGTRTSAAEAMIDWLATDPTGSNDPDFLIIGDINAYAQEDPIRTIKAGPDGILGTADDYIDLIENFVGPGDVAYSYTFFGEAGYLDHGLANSTLLSQVTGVTEWHINSDEPNQRGYNDSLTAPGKPAAARFPAYLYEPNAFRSSDHDPVVIGLNLRRSTESENPTIFRIGDWTETPFAGASGGTALCATGNLARLAIPFDGTSVGVTHVVQPGGGSYALVIPGGTGASPVNTNGTLGLETRTGSTINTGRNVARVEVLSGTVCIDTFDAALNPANALPNSPILLTSSNQLTGPTQARISCINTSARVQTIISYSTASALHELSAVFVTNGEVVQTQRILLTTPSFIATFRFSLSYYFPVPRPAVPGYSLGTGAGNPLNPTDTEILIQFRNQGTGACVSTSYEYACSTGVAALTQNVNTCIFN